MALPRKQDWRPVTGAENRIHRLDAALGRILTDWPGSTTLKDLFTLVRSLRSTIRTIERRGNPDLARPARYTLRNLEGRLRKEFTGAGP